MTQYLTVGAAMAALAFTGGCDRRDATPSESPEPRVNTASERRGAATDAEKGPETESRPTFEAAAARTPMPQDSPTTGTDAGTTPTAVATETTTTATTATLQSAMPPPQALNSVMDEVATFNAANAARLTPETSKRIAADIKSSVDRHVSANPNLPEFDKRVLTKQAHDAELSMAAALNSGTAEAYQIQVNDLANTLREMKLRMDGLAKPEKD